MPPLMRTDAAQAVGSFLAATFVAGYAPGAGLVEQLRAIDVDPARVDFVVNSHLHFDHGGGNALLPNARVVVQRLEAEAAREEAEAAGRGYRARDALDGRDVLEIDGEHDLFGDGSVVLLPTPGHTAGHQSARLRCDGGETILAGDCCYFHRTLTDLKLPGFGHDREAQKRSISRLRGMEQAGARIIPGHDADVWASLPRVPLPMLG